MKITPGFGIAALLSQVFLVGVVVLLLFWRVNLVEFMGWRWSRWWLAPVIGILVIHQNAFAPPQMGIGRFFENC